MNQPSGLSIATRGVLPTSGLDLSTRGIVGGVELRPVWTNNRRVQRTSTARVQRYSTQRVQRTTSRRRTGP